MTNATQPNSGGKDNFPDIIASHTVTIKVDSPPNNPDARDARISHDSPPRQVMPPRRRRHQPKSVRAHASDPDKDDRAATQISAPH
ncbi:hypothetical protein L226DRAFT_536037 [Lentinus tigrinus ALCF2SS1-7]|uniref:uncharacterized protein n=1 Tax=Lentinus tigrinus ALCF2SS1-7 TaxID=1328758 RepID=UPI001166338B|nr:hypothetical protein L226DRAFT_536037 [Lentinus tigrinus ALCF2SS1-7]